jgi:SET domain-containing protein
MFAETLNYFLYLVLGLRLARVNHACNANASYVIDEKFKFGILYSECDIKAGQEITFSYESFKELLQKKSPQDIRETLKEKWSIDCPPGILLI